jgi:hypothetical protein
LIVARPAYPGTPWYVVLVSGGSGGGGAETAGPGEDVGNEFKFECADDNDDDDDDD